MKPAVMAIRPLRIAIVGAGPSGFFAAAELLKRHASVSVDMLDRLPVMGGLARFGVSPDHAARRRIIRRYKYLCAASGRFNFIGNVEAGHDISHAQLLENYHAVVYACGCASDQKLGIAGEDLPGSHSATDFVGWYNGHPDFRSRRFDFSTDRAVVIGNGNVALDVARILLMGEARLRHTDIARHALAALATSRIREVVLLGRRGPAEASFTTPELLELAELDDIDIALDGYRVDGDLPASDGSAAGFARRLKLQIFREYVDRPAGGRPKRLVFKFLSSPQAILGNDRVEGLRLVRNVLESGADGMAKAVPTGEVSTLEAGLVLRAVGYRGRPIPGLPFDKQRGTLPNVDGRVVIDAESRIPVPWTYVVGWQKRGPSGVIGTNKYCAQRTVANLLDDLAAADLARLPAMKRLVWSD